MQLAFQIEAPVDLRLGRFARPGGKGTFVRDNLSGDHLVAAVASNGSGEADGHADLQGRSRPSEVRERIRTTQLASPVIDHPGLRILNIDIKECMRILPLHFSDGAG